ncbi:hypothetical protein [Lactobacillus xylocopicola]|uniref:Uncharacterized protein n=1 Tax=Lactobacillus xylocopicola TaxID=2976676 RepID=A0ABN6SIJ3_9LACO|nr:hypothetical protein [Lactobacillus xylocopicola]BDR59884.1 hypothetical protein KIM322_01450 [Lactobacillus xylocopicola]
MKRKTITYPVQTALALTWIGLGIAWLLHQQLAPAILFTTSGAFMLVDTIMN